MSVSQDYSADSNLILLSIAAALLAAVLAWQLNRLLVYLPGRFLLFLAPLQEEAVKTLLAVYFGAYIFLSHMFFGAVEAVWEISFQRRNSFYAGLAALASHSVFGFIAAFVYALFDAALPAVFAGYLVHLTWNYVVKVLANRRKIEK